MSKRAQGATISIIRRGEVIRASWLNEVAGKAESAERMARKATEAVTEKPEGEDGEGLGTVVFTETARTVTLVWIEDENDPTVRVQFEQDDTVTFANEQGAKMILVRTYPTPS